MLLQEGCDFRIDIGPVALHVDGATALQRVFEAVRAEHALLVGLAGHAPVGGHVDENGTALGAQGRELLRGIGDRGFRGVECLRGRFDAGDHPDRHERGQQQDHRHHARGDAAFPAPALHRPQGQGQDHRAEQDQADRVDATLLAEHPDQPDPGQVHRIGEHLLERFHPGTGFGQARGQGRDEADQQERQGQAEAEGEEDQQGDDRGGGEGEGQGRAHERRRARAGDHAGQHAGEEVAGRSRARGEALAGAGQAGADREHAREAQSDRQQHVYENRDEGRLLKLEAPAQRLAGRAQRDHEQADRGERGQHAGGVPERVAAGLGQAFAALGQADDLEREYRQHAGHQVEDDAAEQGEQQRREDADRGRLRRLRAQGIVGQAAAGGLGRGHWRGDEALRGLGQLLGAGRFEVDRHRVLHDRIADAVFLAALVFAEQLDRLRLAVRALQGDRQFDLVVVDDDRAEVLVGMVDAGRPLWRAEFDAAGVGHPHAALVAVQVIALGHGPAGEDLGRAHLDRLEHEGLLGRQRFFLVEWIERAAEDAAGREFLGQRARCGCRFGDRLGQRESGRMRRVADLRIGLVAALHGDREFDRAVAAIGPLVGQAGFDGIVVDLDVAEELIVLFDALRQIERAELEAGLGGLRADPALVEVIVLCDPPMQGNLARGDDFGIQHIGLFDRQQAILFLGMGDVGESEEGQRTGNDKTYQGTAPVAGAMRSLARQGAHQDGPTCCATHSA